MLIYLSLLDTNEEKTKFEKLYNTYRYTMLYTANSILQDMGLAEDAVHDAFMRIARNFHKIGDVDSPATKGFVVVVVKNVALTMVKAKNGVLIAEDDELFSNVIDSKIDIVTDKISFDFIVNEITALPDIYKDVLYLRFVNELSIKDISRILQLPVDTVKKRIQRGRKLLIDKLTEEGFANG